MSSKTTVVMTFETPRIMISIHFDDNSVLPAPGLAFEVLFTWAVHPIVVALILARGRYEGMLHNHLPASRSRLADQKVTISVRVSFVPLEYRALDLSLVTQPAR